MVLKVLVSEKYRRLYWFSKQWLAYHETGQKTHRLKKKKKKNCASALYQESQFQKEALKKKKGKNLLTDDNRADLLEG